MMTTISLISLLFLSATANSQNYVQIKQVTVVSEQAKINLSTSKVARVRKDIDPVTSLKFIQEMLSTEFIEGDRLILINSNGGWVNAGEVMIDAIKKEQAQGVRVVCVVTGSAHSMAFFLLSYCDVRLMTPGSTALVHNIRDSRNGTPLTRFTANDYRRRAAQLEEAELLLKLKAMETLKVSSDQYDKITDAETEYTAENLLEMGYLHGIAIIKK